MSELSYSESGNETSPEGPVRRPKYKHVPHKDKPAPVVAKRNARERRRVETVNGAFSRLRKLIPYQNRHKRLSKVKTLQIAMNYINGLRALLDEPTEDLQDVLAVHQAALGYSAACAASPTSSNASLESSMSYSSSQGNGSVCNVPGTFSSHTQEDCAQGCCQQAAAHHSLPYLVCGQGTTYYQPRQMQLHTSDDISNVHYTGYEPIPSPQSVTSDCSSISQDYIPSPGDYIATTPTDIQMVPFPPNVVMEPQLCSNIVPVLDFGCKTAYSHDLVQSHSMLQTLQKADNENDNVNMINAVADTGINNLTLLYMH